MKVLILWADHSSANLGVRVLAEGTRMLIEAALPSKELSFTFHDFRGRESGVRLTPAELARYVVAGRGAFASLVREHDLVVDTGAGDSFTDIYGMKRFAALAGVQSASLRLGKPYIFSPQTIGPFHRKLTRRIAARNLSRAHAVISRDGQSTATAASMIGRPVGEGTDVVFALPQPTAPDARFDVLLNVSGLLWRENNHLDANTYRAGTILLARKLMRAGREVTLFAHVLDSADADNDVPAVMEAADELEGLAGTYVPSGLNDVREAIASSNLVVGARMHATLNALSLGVPAIPWAYSRKFAPLLTDLGWDHVVDARRTSTPETVDQTLKLASHCSLLDEARATREAGRARLTATTSIISSIIDHISGVGV